LGIGDPWGDYLDWDVRALMRGCCDGLASRSRPEWLRHHPARTDPRWNSGRRYSAAAGSTARGWARKMKRDLAHRLTGGRITRLGQMWRP
jgi:hypothetical protein